MNCSPGWVDHALVVTRYRLLVLGLGSALPALTAPCGTQRSSRTERRREHDAHVPQRGTWCFPASSHIRKDALEHLHHAGRSSLRWWRAAAYSRNCPFTTMYSTVETLVSVLSFGVVAVATLGLPTGDPGIFIWDSVALNITHDFSITK